MKKIYTAIVILAMAFQSFAQNCTPDPQYVIEGPGVYPDSLVGLPPAYTCQAYSAVITVVVPYDTVIDLGSGPDTTIIDSAVLKSVDDLPPGFWYACEPPNCNFPGGTAGCIVLMGLASPSDTGVYIPVGNVLGYIDAYPGLGLPFAKIDYYIIDINTGGGPVSATVSVANAISCSGACDGSLTVTADCGYPPYSYLWSNGNSTATATGLCLGNYTVTVSDSSGNVIMNFTLTEPDPLSISFSQNSPSSGCNGSVTVNATGGTTPYTYAWTTGDSTQTADSLCAGPYQVTVSDANNCNPVINAVFLTTEINEKYSPAGFHIYPNPATGKFNVEQYGEEEMQSSDYLNIFNLAGECIYSLAPRDLEKREAGKLVIDLSAFPEGTYFVQLQNPGGVFYEKLVLMK